MRIGYDDAITMSDEDIRDAFPGISLLPRDPTAPTSFDGACAWLAARKTRARVLCVGHREGTKGMAGKRVPTPHCCIAIFEAKRGPETTYMLKDLLDKEGIPLGHGDGAGSPFARVRSEAEMPGNVDDTGESVLAGLLEVLPPLEHPEAFLTGDRWLRRSMKTASALQAQRASNQPSRVPPKQRVATRGATQTKHHSGERKKSGGRRQQRPNALAQCLRQNRSNDGKAEDDDHARGGQVVAHHPTGDNGGGGGAGGPVRLTGSRSTAYPDSTSAGSTAESSGNNDSHGRCSELGNSGTGAKGKPAAGGGFRVAALARSSVGGATYKLPKANTLLGISSDALAGSAGVLSFLNARELCVVRTVAPTGWACEAYFHNVRITLNGMIHFSPFIFAALSPFLKSLPHVSLHASDLKRSRNLAARLWPKPPTKANISGASSTRACQNEYEITQRQLRQKPWELPPLVEHCSRIYLCQPSISCWTLGRQGLRRK